jgi:hypothetical protein
MRIQGGLISVFGRNWRATLLSLRPETSRLSKVSKAQLTRNGRGVEDSESQSHVSGPVPPETLKKCDRTRAPVAQPWSPQHRLRCCLVGMRVVLFCVLWHALGRGCFGQEAGAIADHGRIHARVCIVNSCRVGLSRAVVACRYD